MVYDKKLDMQAAAQRHAENVGEIHDGDYHAKAGAVAHSFEKIRIDENGSEVLLPDAGIIRLQKRNLGSEVVTHEVTHLAWNIYRTDCEEKLGSPSKDIENEEILCYLVGDLARKVVKKLYKFGYYDEVK